MVVVAVTGAEASTDADQDVLDAAFAVLEALGRAQDGLGLADLADSMGLSKMATFRLAEELVALGALQHAGDRYCVGERVRRIAQQWQPHPLLRQIAQAPVRALSVQSRGMAVLRALRNDKLWVIAATVPPRYACMPTPICRDSIARTATGQVLYAADHTTEIALLPGCTTPRKWRELRKTIRDLHATVVEHEEAFPGISCVSAPVWWPDGRCAGALTALVPTTAVPPRLTDLVSHVAGRISAGLRQSSAGPVESARLPLPERWRWTYGLRPAGVTG